MNNEDNILGGETVSVFRYFKTEEDAVTWTEIEKARLGALGFTLIRMDFLDGVEIADVYETGDGWCGYVDAEKVEYAKDEVTN